jgi:hypothetical protein
MKEEGILALYRGTTPVMLRAFQRLLCGKIEQNQQQ